MKSREASRVFRRGVTIVEVVTAAVIATVVLAGISALMVDNHRSWSAMYSRAYGDVVTDGYIATKKFESIMRKAASDGVSIDPAGEWVEVQYYASSESTAPDRYARLSTGNGMLFVEYGQLDPRSATANEVVCSSVSTCTFKQAGQSIHMRLALDDGTQRNEVVSCGYMHN
ncbi:MAG: hypothetical protein JW720_16160 [Sedimentisphaerales bacterium]|nr:hypothetical protein [Sedimentisphaerales bacterium]